MPRQKKTTLSRSRPAPSPELRAILDKHPITASALIPLLQDIQDAQGYISLDSMRDAAHYLGIHESSVYGVATFYSQFYLARQGRHKIKVCTGTACHVRGSGEIMKAVSTRLGIGPGETTEDFEFDIERVACFGSCALAPVVVIDDKVYGNMTPAKVVEILDTLE
jgi:NADH-quinone oxidoreductase E subunit